ncbi:MAG: hypothetical protein K6T78_11605 [Alicyclobacillus sp.]|nr:hypothetical protein [Alicyclobacillus sp.]
MTSATVVRPVSQPVHLEIKPGDLIFIRGTEGVAGPIKKITRSPYTHVAGAIFDDRLIESQALRRTGYQDLTCYQGVSDVFTCPRLTEKDRRAIVAYVTKHIGTRYDYVLFGFLACRHLFGEMMPVCALKRRHICTTLWLEAYQSVGIDLCPGITYPTPGELSQSPELEFVGSY